MHGTRTTAKILVGMAVAALSGCVSIEVPPPAPVPPKEVSRPAQDVETAPQIVEGPAREALEAALPDPPPPSPRATPAQRKEKGGAGTRKAKKRPPSTPRPHARVPDARPPEPPRPPRSRADVCELGEQYGGWRPDSPQASICRGTYRK
ncbi:hypothetical protein ACFV9D_35700 [Streptomyces sp. NPDC059875]|uniref:hypothetical protein n=1 Tax=unclassified Streptomyces TaxID=2593676 RepID=UPI003645FE61